MTEHDPRFGGNFVQPVEERDGETTYVTYVGWEIVGSFDNEWDARQRLHEYFPDLLSVH